MAKDDKYKISVTKDNGDLRHWRRAMDNINMHVRRNTARVLADSTGSGQRQVAASLTTVTTPLT